MNNLFSKINIFAPPKTAYDNYYDQSRFNLVWRAGVVFILLMSFVAFSNLINSQATSLPNFIGLAMVSIALIVLQVTKKFKIISIFISTSGLIIISLTFLLMTNALHYATPMWMIINILFTFFTLGKRWGITILFIHFMVMMFYFYFRFSYNLYHLPVFTDTEIFNFATEYAICGFGIAYFLHQFVKTNQYAENKYTEINKALNKQNQVISTQNQEKEVMLKEIHHRVKNNLQVIASMLRLQSNELENDEISIEFTAAIHRINAMGLIHEKMYQSNVLSNFNLENYLNSLATDLITTYSVNKKVELNITSNVTNVGSKTIVPLAIMFNELISNSLKHAFDNTKSPSITVSFLGQNNKQFHLNYEDNGTWKEATKSTFGSELIVTMTEQLDGEFQLSHPNNATKYSFLLRNLDEDRQEKI